MWGVVRHGTLQPMQHLKKAVNRWSDSLLVVEEAEVGVSNIITDDEHDVGLAVGSGRGGGQHRQGHACGKGARRDRDPHGRCCCQHHAGARGSRQKKKRPGRAVAATGVPSVLKRRTQTLNFIPTDHIQRHRLPGPKRFEPPVFAFCIRSISQPGYTTQQPTAVGVHGGSV